MKQQLKIIVPNNNKYTRHLKLTEKQEQELIAYNKAGAVNRPGFIGDRFA
jgi:hypothetical protein